MLKVVYFADSPELPRFVENVPSSADVKPPSCSAAHVPSLVSERMISQKHYVFKAVKQNFLDEVEFHEAAHLAKSSSYALQLMHMET